MLNTLIKQVVQYQPGSQEEETAKELFLDKLRQGGEEILFRSSEALHVTVSAMICNPSGKKVLMVYHHVYQSFSWTGGHVDGSGDLLGVAIREAQEETGIKEVYPLTVEILSLDLLPVIAHEKHGQYVPEHQHINAAFGLIAPDRQPLQVKEDENSAVQWLSREDYQQYCQEPHMLPVYEKVLDKMQQHRQEIQLKYQKLPQALLPWYQAHARKLPWRQDRLPYHVWLSEIMLQQTRVEAVKSYYQRFLSALPTLSDLAAAEEELLMKLWEGLGYYSRVRNLKKAAAKIMEEYQGVFPEDYKQIRALSGIGPYTAGAVASICFEQPKAAVDGNVLRILSRIMEYHGPIDQPACHQMFQEALERVYPQNHCGDFTQSLMELGATICLPNSAPLCDKCPVQHFCRTRELGIQQQLPVRKKKKTRRIEEKTVFYLECNGLVAITKREAQGLMANLWQLPNVDGVLQERSAAELLTKWQTEPVHLEKKLKKKHIFTHIQWDMVCYYWQCRVPVDAFQWVTPEELTGTYALPTAFRQFLK